PELQVALSAPDRLGSACKAEPRPSTTLRLWTERGLRSPESERCSGAHPDGLAGSKRTVNVSAADCGRFAACFAKPTLRHAFIGAVVAALAATSQTCALGFK